MKNINQIASKLLVLLAIGFSMGLQAQVKLQKLKQDFKTDKDVYIVLDTRHTNIVFETWNKNQVEVEAFLETKDEKNKNQHLENWKLQVTGGRNEIRITSGGSMGTAPMAATPMPPMDGLREMMAPLMEEMVAPLLESLAENPLPPQFYENMGSLNFDFKKYEKEGEAYLKQWEKQVEKKLGKDFEKQMESWSKQLEADSESMSKRMEARMKVWEEKHGKQFEKDMEEWGEAFGKKMEAWGEQFGRQMEAQMSGREMRGMPNSGVVKRSIIIKMPKDAVLRLDVRHGEVRLAETSNNINARLTHAKLIAGTIDGQQSFISTSYAPISIKNWEYGTLNTKYVKDCTIENAKNIRLHSNSSDVVIKNFIEMGQLSGSFGNLKIVKLAPDFQLLDITLENSNLVLQLPNAPFNFVYDGSQSKIKYPTAIKATPRNLYGSEHINGYYKANNSDNALSIKARYSDVVVQ